MRVLLPEPGRSLDSGEEREALYATPSSPTLRANFVVTLEGAIEVGGRSGVLGGPDDRLVFATLRALTDVILVGSGTAVAENYGPAKPNPEARARRAGRGQAPVPPVAVVSRSADLDPSARVFDTGAADAPRTLVVTCEAADADRRAALSEVADVLVCGDDEIDHHEMLDQLRARGLAQVLCEGGPRLLTQLASWDLVDQLCLTHAPLLAGPGRGALMVGEEWDRPRTWTLATLAEGDGMLFARYEAVR
jgi:riboflavin biosynthesis pyrimidine reductase